MLRCHRCVDVLNELRVQLIPAAPQQLLRLRQALAGGQQQLRILLVRQPPLHIGLDARTRLEERPILSDNLAGTRPMTQQ